MNGKMTRTESSYQELVLVVENHRKMYALKTKKDLKKLCSTILYVMAQFYTEYYIIIVLY